ncbi:MAG: hypothetical protein MK132_15635 [Lentisphaerales bacterium]|nr:hypothetical protein [Lentisphaerales bacterium]
MNPVYNSISNNSLNISSQDFLKFSHFGFMNRQSIQESQLDLKPFGNISQSESTELSETKPFFKKMNGKLNKNLALV